MKTKKTWAFGRKNIKIYSTKGVELSVLPAVILLLLPTSSRGNIVGTDAQNFVPTTDGLDFVTVHSSRTLAPGILNTGAYLNYAKNSLPVEENTDAKFGDTLLSSDLNVGLGLAPGWDCGLSLPSVLSQDLYNRSGQGIDFSNTGITEVRLNTKYRFLGDDDGGFAGVFSINLGLIQNDPFTGSGVNPAFNFELVYDHAIGDFRVAANAGFRLRTSGPAIPNVPIQPFGNQLIASVAGSYLIEPLDTKLVLEIFGALPTSRNLNLAGRQQSAIESLFALKHDFNTSFAAQIGAGTQLAAGLASPEYRVYAGVNYAFGPLFGEQSKLEVARDNTPYTAASETDPDTAPELQSGALPTAPETLALVASEDHFVAQGIHFKSGSSAIDEGDYEQVLGDLADHLKASPYKKVVVEGHTDSVGGNRFNKKLSLERASTIRSVLINKYGVLKGKVVAKGYGSAHPIASNGNYQGRLQNRRVEFKIIR